VNLRGEYTMTAPRDAFVMAVNLELIAAKKEINSPATDALIDAVEALLDIVENDYKEAQG
jgi:hypothetical protein